MGNSAWYAIHRYAATVDESELGAGAFVLLADCGGASRWEVHSNGQRKLKSAGDFRMTQEGFASGLRDEAANSAAMASATANGQP